MAYDEGVTQRIRDRISSQPGYKEQKMFGGIGFLIWGNMACGVIRDDLIVRVGAERYTDSLLKPHVELFDMTGRAMTGWVIVKEPGYRDDQDLEDWISQGIAYALTLPAK